MKRTKRNKKLNGFQLKQQKQQRQQNQQTNNETDDLMKNLLTEDFVKNLYQKGDNKGINDFRNKLINTGFFNELDFIPMKSSHERISYRGNIKIYDCGDIIFRTDIPELKEYLDENLLGNGLPNTIFFERDLQKKYPVPMIVGGNWKKDNWNVYQNDIDNKPYEQRGRYELENSTKTIDDMNFIRESK